MKLQENEVKPTWLYIKYHSVTGLKYFGCTTKYRARNYDGSGTYWSNHIKKYGRKAVVTDLLIGPYTNKEELRNLALWISNEFDIVNSDDWANLALEDGMALSGSPGKKGFKHTEEAKRKIAEASKGRTHNIGRTPPNKGISMSDEQRIKISNALTGIKHSEEQNEAKRLRQLGSKHKPHIFKQKYVCKRIECPHCGKIGGGSNMTRYHFNNCKYKET